MILSAIKALITFDKMLDAVKAAGIKSLSFNKISKEEQAKLIAYTISMERDVDELQSTVNSIRLSLNEIKNILAKEE